MRLYGAIQKVEPQDDGTVRVHGIATSEAVDEQGEIVRADAIRAAIPDYMRFPALREMHQLSAAGTTLEAEVCEDGTTRIVAHVVDPVAVTKVRNQVYRGFSIGGRVTQREAGNPTAITGLVLNEISLVDRPANPEAVFDCWKSSTVLDGSPGLAEHPVVNDASLASVQALLGQQPFNAPIQIWACSIPDHRHLAKVDALKCLTKEVGFTEDERGSVVARASAVNDERAGPGTECRKNSAEFGETDSDVQYHQPDSKSRQLAGGIMMAKHSRADQALLDMAYFACNQCLKMDGLSVDEREDMDRACSHLQEAGAMPTSPWTTEDAEDKNSSWPPRQESAIGDGAEVDTVKLLGIVTRALCKRERAHENLMDVAHECLDALTDGRVCEHVAKVGARHSKETMERFNASHRHLVAAGARCDMADVDHLLPTIKLASGATDRLNTVRDERGEKAALARVLGEVVPMLERLAKRVDEIACTPLPPLTMAKGTVSVSKQQDRENNIGSIDPELSPEAIAAALAKMSKEEQTLTLIKASYATPIRIPGSAADQH